MSNILHRLTIDAPAERVHELTVTSKGIEQWWTGRAVGGDAGAGRFAVSFGDNPKPAATFEVIETDPRRVVWRCVEGPQDWIDTSVVYELSTRTDGGTTLLFSHQGWREENEFMHGCSTNWAAYLMSLKSGAEDRGFNAYPGGEISRWS